MRIEEVYQNNQKLKELKLSTHDGREMATLAVLTDISETLAMMLDMYGVVHGRVVSMKGEQPNADGK